MLGGPFQTTECLPSSWGSDITYTGTQCPPRYTEACRVQASGGAVTCCPTVDSFSCMASSDLATAPDASLFRCESQYTDNGTDIVTRTYMAATVPSSDVETQTYKTNLHLFALAIVWASPTAVSNE